ncbi:Phosphatidylinositol-glycan biosynthesis class F protein [Spatholobus suberectus]|nr:Phosphatidylinositol-glycan biosynthesis class F protein [Spatholobus suberectus]
MVVSSSLFEVPAMAMMLAAWQRLPALSFSLTVLLRRSIVDVLTSENHQHFMKSITTYHHFFLAHPSTYIPYTRNPTALSRKTILIHYDTNKKGMQSERDKEGTWTSVGPTGISSLFMFNRSRLLRLYCVLDVDWPQHTFQASSILTARDYARGNYSRNLIDNTTTSRPKNTRNAIFIHHTIVEALVGLVARSRSLERLLRRSSSMDRRKSSEKPTSSKASTVEASPPIPASEAFIVNALCLLGLAFAFWVANTLYSIDLVTDPSLTLFFIWITELPIVIVLYSRCRQNRQRCTYLRAVGRGVLGVPVGALLNFLGAIALGAPVTFQYLPKTVNWALMMSVFTTVPASCVLGSSWADWQRIFAQTKPNRSIEYLICLPAHGAVIGAWFGAWPMPLDWERPWQEWPISVSYGTIAGYLVALVASLGFVLACGRSQHIKRE